MFSAYGAMFLPVKNWTAYNIYLSFLFGPFAAGIFQFFPVAPVQIVVLGTDVGHVETFLHGFPVPAVVAGGAHVSAVHSGAFIVVGSYCLAFGQVGVGQEFVGTAVPFYQFFGRQFPCHPVGYLVLAVVRGGIALAVQYLFGHVFQRSGKQGTSGDDGCCFLRYPLFNNRKLVLQRAGYRFTADECQTCQHYQVNHSLRLLLAAFSFCHDDTFALSGY